MPWLGKIPAQMGESSVTALTLARPRRRIAAADRGLNVAGNDTPLSDLSRAARYPEPMHACHFCGSPTPSQWAVTARNGDAPNDRWRREIVPICPRCNRLLGKAGPEGCRLKTTGEWWYAGHSVGRHFNSPGAKAMLEHAEGEPEKG